MDDHIDVRLRERLNLIRGDWLRIATAAGVSHSWISQFVRGKIRNPGIETLRAVASAADDALRLKALLEEQAGAAQKAA